MKRNIAVGLSLLLFILLFSGNVFAEEQAAPAPGEALEAQDEVPDYGTGEYGTLEGVIFERNGAFFIITNESNYWILYYGEEWTRPIMEQLGQKVTMSGEIIPNKTPNEYAIIKVEKMVTDMGIEVNLPNNPDNDPAPPQPVKDLDQAE